MKVFENTLITKESFLFHLKSHQDRDAGCSISSIAAELGEGLNVEDHSIYEAYLGIPEWVARLESTLFEGISDKRRKTFPVEFGEALNEGSDLNEIKPLFIMYVMRENLKTLDKLNVNEKEHKKVFDAIKKVKKAIYLVINTQDPCSSNKVESAVRAAWLAESSAWSAAWSIEAAARHVAKSVWQVARSVESTQSTTWSKWATWSLVKAVELAESDSTTNPDISIATFEKHADKLLELIRECK